MLNPWKDWDEAGRSSDRRSKNPKYNELKRYVYNGGNKKMILKDFSDEFKPHEEVTLKDLENEMDRAANINDWVHIDDLLDIYLEKLNGIKSNTL